MNPMRIAVFRRLEVPSRRTDQEGSNGVAWRTMSCQDEPCARHSFVKRIEIGLGAPDS